MASIANVKDEALKGRELWLKIKEKYQVSNEDVIVLVREPGDEMGQEVIRQMNSYLNRKYLKRAIIITQETNACNTVSNILYHTELKDGIKCIEQYYRLAQFTKNIVVASGDTPFGGDGIVGKNNISVAEYVADAILV